MTMTPERLAELDAAVARFPVSLPWIFTPTERDGVTGIHGEPHPVGDKFAVAYLADVFGNAAPVVEVMNAIPDLRAMIDAQAATIAGLREALRNALASLVAATSLLERGGKKAAPSDKMFAQMLVDYNKSAAAARAALTANHSEHGSGK